MIKFFTRKSYINIYKSELNMRFNNDKDIRNLPLR